jgi:hypothetical protein
MSEITANPVMVNWDHTLPTYPKAAAKAIKDYETAHGAWAGEYAELAACQARISLAAAEDAAALSAAVATGQTDDGGREVKAKRAEVVANERTAQARDRATATSDILKAALAAAGPALVAPVIANIRAAADTYEGALAAAKATVAAAREHLQDSYGGMLMLNQHMAAAGMGVMTFQSAVDVPTWPQHPLVTVRARLDLIEATVARTAASPAA